jgi:hypothetical protein
MNPTFVPELRVISKSVTAFSTLYKKLIRNDNIKNSMRDAHMRHFL